MKRPLWQAFCILALLVMLSMFFPQANAQADAMIRVYLRRLQVQDSLHIAVEGTYMLEDGSMYFQNGAQLDVVLRDGQLVLHTGEIVVVMGNSITMRRCEDETPGALLLQGESGRYEGDLRLSVADGVIRPVLTLGVEDYLLGVVPYEMGDSFPLEALKAQAIAARTYALRKSGSSGDYDVEDTTNDQAYRGRSTSSPLSEKAVRETEGICGVYKGTLAQCFYSASNGGQTELGQHVWPTSDPDAYGYMDMRDDPYDLENEASPVKRYTLNKKPGEHGIGTALHSALVAALAPQIEALQGRALDDLVRFDEILKVEAVTPRYDGESRLMTELRFTVRISLRDALFRDTQASAQKPTTPAQTPSAEPTPSPTPAPTATPLYSQYVPVEDTLVVTLPIFTTAEQAMGLSINVSRNELVTVCDIGSSFMIESRRYGHGVGMSQRGAQQMAGIYGMTCEQILTFYYPGMELAAFNTQPGPKPTPDALMLATPAPTPSPTPRPTLTPVSDALLEGEYLAVGANIDEDSSLNLREAPSLSSDVRRRLYKDQQLVVMSISADGWAHVRTDVIDGYVRAEYLQTAGSP